MSRKGVEIGRFLVAALLTTAGIARAQEPVVWLTGRGLQRKLDESAGLQLQGIPLRRAIEDFARQERVCVALDRRIDPSRPVACSQSATVYELVELLARQRGAAVAPLRNLLYVGPPEAASALNPAAQALRAQVERLDKSQRGPLVAARRFGWDDLTEPRELLDRLAREAGWTIDSAGQIPHDLWAAADWPPLAWVDRATLILIQFDQTLELDASSKTARCAPLPPEWSRTPLPARPARRSVNVGQPTARLEIREAPLGEVLRSVAAQFGHKLQLSEGLPRETLERPVTLSVRDVGLEALLSRLLEGRNLAFAIEDGVIRVEPR